MYKNMIQGSIEPFLVPKTFEMRTLYRFEAHQVLLRA